MDVELVILRILHIGFGVFWVGSAMFMSLILEPRLRALGPAIQRPVMMAIAPIMGPAVGISGGITIAAGITLYLRLHRGGLVVGHLRRLPGNHRRLRVRDRRGRDDGAYGEAGQVYRRGRAAEP